MASLDLLVLRCADVTATQAFYEELGLLFTEEQHDDGPAHLAATLPRGTVVELYPATVARPPELGLRLGFGIEQPADVAGRLEAAGRARHAASGPPSFTDPDGRIVVLGDRRG